MGALEAVVAIRRLFESGFAKAPSEAAVPAPRDRKLTRSGAWWEGQLVGRGAVVQKKEGGGVSQQRRKQKRIEAKERGKREAKRNGAVGCGAVVVMIKKKGGGGLLWLRTIIQYRQAGSNRLGWLDDGNNKCRCSGKAA